MGYPPPFLTEKIRLVVFDGVPEKLSIIYVIADGRFFFTPFAPAYLSVSKDRGGISAPLCIYGLVWVMVLNFFIGPRSDHSLPVSVTH